MDAQQDSAKQIQIIEDFIAQGVSAVFLNPVDKDAIEPALQKLDEAGIPVVNFDTSVSNLDLVGSYVATDNYQAGVLCAEAMIASCDRHVKILEELDFHDIVLSFKSSDVELTIDVYEKASQHYPYPLHLGVTEAGGFTESAVKSSAALGTLLHEGIGDTIRVSVSAPPKDELIIGKKLLKAFHLTQNVPDLVACPTCGRIQYDMLPLVKEIEEYLETVHEDITVAIMGCPVNGIQEAGRADIGVAGGYDSGLLFRKGEVIRRVPQNEIKDALIEEINKLIEERKH